MTINRKESSPKLLGQVIGIYITSYLFTTIWFFLGCWALHVFGVNCIGSWVVAFTWKANTAFWLLSILFRFTIHGLQVKEES